VVLTPEETNWACLWLASAHALFVVKDFVIATNLGSADASTFTTVGGVVPEVGVSVDAFAHMWNFSASTQVEAPVFSFVVAINVRGTLAIAVVGTPEGAFFTKYVVADTVVNVEIPVFTTRASVRNLLAIASSILMDVPEIANCTLLRLLFAAAVHSVEVPSVTAEVVWAASAFAGVEVPSVASLACSCRRSTRAGALARVPELIFTAAICRWQAQALAGVDGPVLIDSACACWLEAVALAAFIVENIVAWAGLAQAAAHASIFAVEELVRAAMLNVAVANAACRVPVEVWWAVVWQDRAATLIGAVVELLSITILIRARILMIFEAVPNTGVTVPGVSAVTRVCRSLSWRANAAAVVLTPVTSITAKDFGVWHAFASAVVIIKLIIRSAIVSNASAFTFSWRCPYPSFVLCAFAWDHHTEAIVSVCLTPVLKLSSTVQIEFVESPAVSAHWVWLV